MWDSSKCFHFVRRNDDTVWVNFGKKISASVLTGILLEVDGVKDASIVCNKNWSRAYAFIAASKENRTDLFKRLLREKVFS